jgi:long-chain acyl-CoA synthetase
MIISAPLSSLAGGAPLAPHVEDFLRVALCCPVVQGYGLTETCAASFIAVPDTFEHASTVGPPLSVLSFRLEAVPEMNYDPNATPPRGEVCVKGPSVFSGYYKAEDKTAEVLDADGWFHTGDIGEITPTGALRIIDRKKNIFKLSQGEYIAVEKVEGVYKMNTLVEQIFV